MIVYMCVCIHTGGTIPPLAEEMNVYMHICVHK